MQGVLVTDEIPSAGTGKIGMDGTAEPLIGDADLLVLTTLAFQVVAERDAGHRGPMACDNAVRQKDLPRRLIHDERTYSDAESPASAASSISTS